MPTRRRLLLLLCLVLLAAAGLRVAGCFGQGYPLSFNADEDANVKRALRLGAEGTLDPAWYNKPALGYYMLFGEYGAMFVLGWLSGIYEDATDFGMAFIRNPGPFYLVGRLGTSLMGVVTVLLVYLLGRRIHGRTTGVAGAMVLAVATGHVASGQVVKMHVPAAMLAVWAAIHATGIQRRGAKRDYLAAGLLVGLATATMYSAAALVAVLVFAHLFRERAGATQEPRLLLSRRLALGLGAVAGGFFLGSPFHLLNPAAPRVWLLPALERMGTRIGLLQGFLAQRGGGWGSEGFLGALGEQLYVLGGSRALGLPVCLLAVLGLVAVLRRRSRREGLLVGAVLAVMLLLGAGLSPAPRPRHLVMLMPFAALLAGRGFVALLGLMGGRLRGRRAALGLLVLAALLALPLPGMPLYETARTDLQHLEPDPRMQARSWIEAHVEPGSVVMVDHDRVKLRPAVRRCDWALERLDRLEARDRLRPGFYSSYRWYWKARRRTALETGQPTYDVVVLVQPWLTESLEMRDRAGSTYNPLWPRSPWSWLLPWAVDHLKEAGTPVGPAGVQGLVKDRLGKELRGLGPVELWTRVTPVSRPWLTRGPDRGSQGGGLQPVAWLVTTKVSYANYKKVSKKRNFPDFAAFYRDLESHYDCYELNGDGTDPTKVVRIYDLRERLTEPRVRAIP